MTTGELIRAARKKAGLTQKRLGELCGIAEPTIRRYELNKLNPKRETLKKIAIPLGVQWYDLIPDSQDIKGKEILDELQEAADMAPVNNEYVAAFFNPSIQEAALAIRKPGQVYKNSKAEELSKLVTIVTYLSFCGIVPPNLESLVTVGFEPNEAFLMMDVLSATKEELEAVRAGVEL